MPIGASLCVYYSQSIIATSSRDLVPQAKPIAQSVLTPTRPTPFASPWTTRDVKLCCLLASSQPRRILGIDSTLRPATSARARRPDTFTWLEEPPRHACAWQLQPCRNPIADSGQKTAQASPAQASLHLDPTATRNTNAGTNASRPQDPPQRDKLRLFGGRQGRGGGRAVPCVDTVCMGVGRLVAIVLWRRRL